MATTCPNGHASATDDYCDTCGARIGAAASGPVQPGAAVADDAPGEPCPECGAARMGAAPFCECCGYDFVAGERRTAAPEALAAPVLEAVVTADRDYFERVGPEGLEFPPYCPARTFPLDRDRVTIGRHSESRGTRPEIDLSGPPLDPAVSHLHAILIREDGGTYSLVDPGSSNGTSINEDLTPIPANEPTRVSAGDRIHIGAWTTLTLRAAGRDGADD
jgi:hypothetical protein